MSDLVKITNGPHAGTVAHVTSRVPQYGGMNVTPIYGDPLVSLFIRRQQAEPIEGFWTCDKCGASDITAHLHAGCGYGAKFHRR